MIIGVPKEIKTDEFRVGITPSGVMECIKAGHRVLVEQGAGIGSGFSDAQYSDAGAVILSTAEDIYEGADMILKVKEPMSEIAGRMATLFGAVHLGRYNGGSGRLLGGAVGVERNRVLVLGAGVAGKSAADAAAGLGAEVVMMDINTERLTYLRDVMAPNVTMLYSTHDTILEQIKTADLIIGTVLLPGAKAPKLITRDMLTLMKKGTVLVDVSIDQGGCFETSHPTTHSHPTFEVEGIVHYCVANMPGMYPRTSTVALTNATLPYAIKIASTPLKQLLKDELYIGALNTYEGEVTNEAVAVAHGMNYKEIL